MNDARCSPSFFSILNFENSDLQVCKSHTSQTDIIANYIREGLSIGEGIVVFATRQLRKSILSRLQELGVDVDASKSAGQIKLFDAELALRSFFIDGELEKSSFDDFVAQPIYGMQSKFGKVRAMSEMVDLLCKQGHQEEAMQLEDIWDKLFNDQNFSALFTYGLNSIDHNFYDDFIKFICKGHIDLIPTGMYEALKSSLIEGLEEVFSKTWNEVLCLIPKENKITA